MLEENIREMIRYGTVQAHQQGMQQGQLLGRIAMLQGLISTRFGQVPQWLQQQIQCASVQDLETWGKRLFFIKDLEELRR